MAQDKITEIQNSLKHVSYVMEYKTFFPTLQDIANAESEYNSFIARLKEEESIKKNKEKECVSEES